MNLLRLRPNHRTIECSLALTSSSHHHITKGLFLVVLFTQYIMSGYQKTITSQREKQRRQFEGTKQASEPDMAGMLGLSVWEF